MDYTPFLPKHIDVSKITYQPPKKNTNGGKSVRLNYGGERLVLQLPVMHMPYGITDAANLTFDKNAKKQQQQPPRYVVDVSFRGKEESKPLNNFFDKLQEIEAKIKKDVFANRVTWLNDRYEDMEALVAKLFSSNLRFDKDKETGKILNRYPPTFRAKLPYRDETETFSFDSYDMDGNELDFMEIKDTLKGAKTRLTVELVGLWFAGGKYGCTWKVINGYFQKSRIARYKMVEDSDEEGDVIKKATTHDEDDDDDLNDDVVAAVQNLKVTPASKAPVTVVSESEEEDDDEEVEEEEEEEEEREPTPPPPPPPKKKTTTTKKTMKV